MSDLPLAQIEQARQRIAGYVRRTPLLAPPPLHGDLPPRLRLKLENLQLTGSFKVRGAFNTLLQLDPDQRRRGVVSSSSGNHGVAVAYAAHRLGIPATIYLPVTASEDRAERIAEWGARVIRHGRVWDESHARGLEQAAAEDQAYIHPFGETPVIAGQGTLGLELLEDAPEMDAVVVAIGGGGLIGGIAAAVKQTRPGVRVIGVEPTGAASMLHSRQAGAVAPLPALHTIADTLAAKAVVPRTFALAERYVDDLVTVTDTQMVEGMRWLWRECNQLVEPASAAAIAAVRANPALLDGSRQPVVLVCGGNAAAGCVFDDYARRARD